MLLSSFFSGDLLSLASFAGAASFESFFESLPSFLASFPASLGASFASFFASLPSFLASLPASFGASFGASFPSFLPSFLASLPASLGAYLGGSFPSFLASFESFLFLSSLGGDTTGYTDLPPFLSSELRSVVLFLSSALGGYGLGGSGLLGSCLASE